MRAMIRLLTILLAPLAGNSLAVAEGERAGEFDYYVMALSWNASWCEREGDGRGAEQCEAKYDLGFTLHGLWPQYKSGWPDFCRTTARDPSRRQSDSMTDIMGSGGLAWYQWKKHGRCSGLSGTEYYDLARKAYDSITRPEVFRKLPNDVKLPPHVVEEAFIEANPGLKPDGVTVTCRDGFLQEVRICLSKDLEPRPCAPDTARDCSSPAVEMPMMR